MSEIKIFSWNVNGLRAVLRKGAIQDFLSTYQPDILCLQEIKCYPDQLDMLEMAELENAYDIIWNPAEKAGYSGTAILLRRDCNFTNNEEFLAENRNFQANAKLASSEGRIIILDLNSFYLINVYTPNSKPDLSRLELREKSWDPEFLNLLKELEKTKPVVTCGDFNVAHEEMDLARPKSNHKNAGFTNEERKGIDNLVRAGFMDTFRHLFPKEKRYTWWSHWGHARENNIGWRIDYFFISKSLKPKLLSAEIYEQVQGSDHCPVSITMEN